VNAPNPEDRTMTISAWWLPVAVFGGVVAGWFFCSLMVVASNADDRLEACAAEHGLEDFGVGSDRLHDPMTGA
jgi:hypothetical protein